MNTYSGKKQELLDLLLQNEGINDEQQESIPVRKDRTHIPLSFSQHRIWFMDQLEPDSNLYTMASTNKFYGDVQINLLAESINELVKRHEGLRTVFKMVDGKAEQEIIPAMNIELPLIDIQHLEPAEKEKRWMSIAENVSNTPFNLEKGPLLRTTLIQLSGKEFVFVLAMHHIISDGWSIGIFLKEFTELYYSKVNNTDPLLDDLHIQYADYAIWQREKVNETKVQEHLSYWMGQLKGISPLELPSDRPRPRIQTYAGLHHLFHIPGQISRKIIGFSKKQEITLFVILLAAFKALLFKYTGQNDICIGFPIANRSIVDVEHVIGCFINTIVLRTNISDDISVLDLTKQINDNHLDAQANQDVPFEWLVTEIEPERDLSRSPLFQVMFIFQNAPIKTPEFAGLAIEPVSIENGTSKFDVTLSLEENNGIISGWIEYNTDLFDTSSIIRLKNHYITLVESMICDPGKKISELDILTPEERETILYKWNDTSRDYSPFKPIHAVFEEQAEKTPGKTALIYESDILTYKDFNQQCNRLAHYLLKLGAGKETPVAVCMERSVYMVTALYAILKTGSAYVPVDPGFPGERIDYILRDTKVPLVVTLEKYENLFKSRDVHRICLDREQHEIRQESIHNPSCYIEPGDMAYIIYTSGSTGKPKGVINLHKGIHNRLLWMQDEFGLKSDDLVLQKTPYSFDVSVWEFFWPLMFGAGLVIAKPGGHKDPEYLIKTIVANKITTIHFVPSMLKAFIESPEVSTCNGILRRVIASGEALGYNVTENFFGKLDAELANLYGPTEAAVDVTCWRCHKDNRRKAIPIGKPIANTRIYILDKTGKPVPVGVPGELHIGGVSLARGYVNNDALTALSFIPDPVGQNRSDRVYKTGDKARYLPDGNIEFLGRIDNQVKIRGFRIEPGEIEYHIQNFPGIKECVVIDYVKSGNNVMLVAYIVQKKQGIPGQGTIIIEDVKSYLNKKLPEYMIPSFFIFIDEIPLSKHGKLDRSKLPAPEYDRTQSKTTYKAPERKNEIILAEIFKEILKLDKVGVHDNFFDLGGDSILSIQVISRAKEAGLHFDLKQLFEAKTIYELVNLLESTVTAESVSYQIQPFDLISKEDREKIPDYIEDAYPASALQTGMFFHSEFDYSGETMYLIISTIHIEGKYDNEKFTQALNLLFKKHSIFRTSFDMATFSIPMQLVHKEVKIPLEVYDISHESSEEQEKIIKEWFVHEKKCQFDLGRPPLMKFVVHKRGDNSFQLGTNEHHSILDGWSDALLIRDLFFLYTSLLQNKRIPDNLQLAAQYRDYIYLEQHSLQSGKDRQFWLDQLNRINFIKLPRFSSDRENPDKWGELIVNIPGDINQRIDGLSSRLQIPKKSILLAAHLKVLEEYSNEKVITTGIVLHGRPDTNDGENIIGLCLNTLPFTLELANESWVDLISKVFKTEMEIYPYRRYPVSEIQKLNKGNPLFETVFNYVHFHAISEIKSYQDLTFRNITSIGQTNFPFSASFFRNPIIDNFGLLIWYNPDEYNEEFIREMSGCYIQVLRLMIENPFGTLNEKSILPENLYKKVVVEFNRTEKEYDRSNCVHKMVEKAAIKNLSHTAVEFQDQAISYKELDRKSNQLGYYFMENSVKKSDRVIICMNRSINFIITMLAVLKTGATYVPIDPNYPEQRIRYIIEDTDASLVVTDNAERPLFKDTRCRVFDLSTGSESLERMPHDRIEIQTGMDDLAYIVYTSGSTGRPKGVRINHGNLLNLVHWYINQFKISNKDKGTVLASVGFDAAVFETWPFLCAGAALSIVPGEIIGASEQLKTWMTEKQISFGFLPTPLTEEFLGLDWSDGKSRLRGLLTGGDQLKCFSPAGLPFELFNCYGPTENSVVASFGPVREHPGVALSMYPSIGVPLDNVKTFILNGFFNPVPVGVPGELCLSGKSLSPGYWNNEELTNEKFIDNPFLPGEKMYTTGDICRWLPDGEIDFIGRKDGQVKIRGIRIESGEIESILKENDLVRNAIVIPREDQDNRKRLVAFLEYNRENLYRYKNDIELLNKNHVEQWEYLFDDTYGETREGSPDFNITGWNSSYTGQAIPGEEMQEWVDNAVEEILSFKPKRVLEIGCGTGLLLFRIAPHCDYYCGTDFSQKALDYIDERKGRLKSSGVTIETVKCEADRIGESVHTRFDLVILNSIIQYFPNSDYLYDVINQAQAMVVPGGRFFIGDVRSLPLFHLYHTSVELYKAHSSETIKEVQIRINQKILNENELLVDPGFFRNLRQGIKRIRNVRVIPEKSRYLNELTKFRYQVVLTIDENEINKIPVFWHDYGSLSDVSDIASMLEKEDIIGFGQIPDDRLSFDLMCRNVLDSMNPENTIGDVKEMLKKEENRRNVKNEIENQAELHGFYVYTSWSSHGPDGSYDIVLSKKPLEHIKDTIDWDPPSREEKSRDGYTNNPVRSNLLQFMEKELKQWIARKVPDYMVPPEFVIVDSFPLTNNGKIDRKLLLTLSNEKSAVRKNNIKLPSTEIEEKLYSIWKKLLAVPEISIDDNFFEIGGDSLLAVRLMALVKKEFDKKYPISILFEAPTIQEIARRIEAEENRPEWDTMVCIRKTGNKSPVFCVPGIGGNVLGFNDLAQNLRGDRPVYGLQSRGLDGIKKPFEKLEEMAGYYIREIKKIQGNGPYILLGHSSGCKVTYEMSQQLIKGGEKVTLLITFDTAAMVLTAKPLGNNWDDGRWICDLAARVDLFLPENRRMNLSYTELAEMDEEKQLLLLKKKFTERNLMPVEVNLTQVRGFVEVFKSGMKMEYTPRSRYPVPTLIFKAEKRVNEIYGPDENGSIDRMLKENESWGWDEYTGNEYFVYHLGGDHSSILLNPHVREAARIIEKHLDGEETGK
ncbi:MAG: amino acid adenylation domain-containing protein [Spirochaetales bacterium]|nr:amino acid adenylation domain-containing protein [Spirochaetales bacterium]